MLPTLLPIYQETLPHHQHQHQHQLEVPDVRPGSWQLSRQYLLVHEWLAYLECLQCVSGDVTGYSWGSPCFTSSSCHHMLQTLVQASFPKEKLEIPIMLLPHCLQPPKELDLHPHPSLSCICSPSNNITDCEAIS